MRRGELERSLFRLLGTRGGSNPEPTTVVSVDDAHVAFPAYRRWAVSVDVGAVAAQYSYAGVINADGAGSLSALVVEGMQLNTSVASDFIVINGADLLSPVLGSVGDASDVAPEATGSAAANLVSVGNVRAGQVNQVGAVAGGFTVPYIVGGLVLPPWITPDRFPAMIIGPQRQLVIRSSVLNTTLRALFWGRYYSAL